MQYIGIDLGTSSVKTSPHAKRRESIVRSFKRVSRQLPEIRLVGAES